MSKTASSMKGPHCFLRVTHFTLLKPLHPETQVNLSASQPIRQVPLTVCTHCIYSVPPSAYQHGLSITTKPQIDIYTVIYKILLRLLIRCAPHWSFLICIKISWMNKQFYTMAALCCLQETFSLDLNVFPGGLFTTPCCLCGSIGSFRGSSSCRSIVLHSAGFPACCLTATHSEAL